MNTTRTYLQLMVASLLVLATGHELSFADHYVAHADGPDGPMDSDPVGVEEQSAEDALEDSQSELNDAALFGEADPAERVEYVTDLETGEKTYAANTE